MTSGSQAEPNNISAPVNATTVMTRWSIRRFNIVSPSVAVASPSTTLDVTKV